MSADLDPLDPVTRRMLIMEHVARLERARLEAAHLADIERRAKLGMLTMPEALQHAARFPSAQQRLASSAIWQLVLERSNLDSLDLRTGMNAAIRGAILRAGGDRRRGVDTLLGVHGVAPRVGEVITALNGSRTQQARVLAYDTKSGELLVEWLEDDDGQA